MSGVFQVRRTNRKTTDDYSMPSSADMTQSMTNAQIGNPESGKYKLKAFPWWPPGGRRGRVHGSCFAVSPALLFSQMYDFSANNLIPELQVRSR